MEKNYAANSETVVFFSEEKTSTVNLATGSGL